MVVAVTETKATDLTGYVVTMGRHVLELGLTNVTVTENVGTTEPDRTQVEPVVMRIWRC